MRPELEPHEYCDSLGFPGTKAENQPDGTWDGGDTAAIVGTIIALSPPFHNLLPKVRMLIPSGTPLRHYNWHKWYGRSDRFSRDQLIPIICAAVRKPDHIIWQEFYEAHKQKRFLTAWNTRGNGSIEMPKKFPDVTGPEVWALWLRYRKPKWAPYVLWLLDFELLLSSLTWKFRKDFVTRNHMLAVITSRRTLPTWVSRLAYRLTDFPDLITRWHLHCRTVGEYPTWKLFQQATKEIK